MAPTDANRDVDAPTHCPECGSYTRHENDPCLPPTHVNVVCASSTCHVGLVAEGVEKFDESEVVDPDVADAVRRFADHHPVADVEMCASYARRFGDITDEEAERVLEGWV